MGGTSDAGRLRAATFAGRDTARRALLRGAALGGVGLALGGLKAGTARADASESLGTIINIALTAEYLAVTFYGNAIANAAAVGITDPVDLGYLRAAQAEEQDHITILELMGGQTLTDTFSTPDGTKTFSDMGTFVSTLVALETAFIAAYLAAVAESAAGQSDVAQLAARIATVEAEHKALARDIGGLSHRTRRPADSVRAGWPRSPRTHRRTNPIRARLAAGRLRTRPAWSAGAPAASWCCCAIARRTRSPAPPMRRSRRGRC